MDETVIWAIWLAVAYLAGAVPFGIFIARCQGVDLRAVGSGNVGATNVGRALGKKWGLICFALDVTKGLAPVVGYGIASGQIAGTPDEAAAGAALAAVMWLSIAAATVVGHVFPVWLRFKGGKGVATGLGALLGVWPMLTVPAAAAVVLWLVVVKQTGYVSLASMVAAGLLPVLAAGSGVVLARPTGEVAVYVAVTAALAGLVVLRHRSNISRLREGTEDKVGWAKRG
ncbi:glycerol-3-phosphate 1-O-acyltransferase PlsY [Phycisphaerales bacterium AB-hyl4]|uniref:Glycerol-3-phosphate acyltransferase n=1 Tax=Natronomicrosphaera hydrolytica TaxID=3242702 RepID=A0ABV4U6A4_9BACT